MIKTFKHYINDLNTRDKDINLFTIENKVFAIQTNCIDNTIIISTIFYESKSK